MRTIRSSLLICLSLAATAGSARAAEVVGVGNFSHIVSDIERAAEFYSEVLELVPNLAPTAFSANPAIMQLGATPGAQSRIATFSIPGSELGVELIEYKDIARGHAQIQFQDPGATVLQLRVRDLNGILTRLVESRGRIWTPSGEPVPFGESFKIIFIQDPDGIFIELIEDSNAPAGEGNVYGASFELIIADSAANAAFYRAGLGADPVVGEAFDDTPMLNETVDTHGGAFRRTTMTIPSTAVEMAFLEFEGVYRKPLRTRVQDPGTALLQLYVDDVPAMTDRLVAAGGTLITTGGGPVDLGGGRLLSIVRDPNNLYIELMPSR